MGFWDRFLKPQWFLGYIVLFATTVFMATSGILPAVIDTLQLQYGFDSTSSGVLMTLFDIVGVVTCVPIGYYGARRNKASVTAWGFAMSAVGALMFALPMLVLPKYSPDTGGTEAAQLCTPSNSLQCSSTSSVMAAYAILSVAHILLAAGFTPLLSISSVYLQENVDKHTLGLYLAIFQASLVIGPAIGFVLSGLFLLEWVNLSGAPPGADPEDATWVGAWWLGFVVAGALGIATFWFGFIFPKQLPGTEKVREALEQARTSEVEHPDTPRLHAAPTPAEPVPSATLEESAFGDLGTSASSWGDVCRNLATSIRVVFRSRTTMFITGAAVLDALIITGFGNFLPKILQYQWDVSASMASILTGAVSVPGAAGGALFGGWIVKKYKMTVEQVALTASVFSVIGAGFMFGLFIKCPTPVVAGINADYPASPLMAWVPDPMFMSCNSNCSCFTQGTFNPVCGPGGVTYYSPCFAGCTASTESSFTNCSCVVGVSSLADAVVQSGQCSSSCSTLPIVCVLLAFGMFMLFASAAPALTVVMRVLPPEHVSVGLGVMQTLWKLGSFPGAIIMGAIFDSACMFSEHDCTTGGDTCVLYNNSSLSMKYAIFGVFCKLGASLFYFMAYIAYRTRKAAQGTRARARTRSRSRSHSDGGGGVELPSRPRSPSGVRVAPASSPISLAVVGRVNADVVVAAGSDVESGAQGSTPSPLQSNGTSNTSQGSEGDAYNHHHPTPLSPGEEQALLPHHHSADSVVTPAVIAPRRSSKLAALSNDPVSI